MTHFQFQLHFSQQDRYALDAYLTVQPLSHSEAGSRLSRQALLEFLKRQGIVYGIHHRTLTQIIRQGKAQRELIATGIPPEKGENAYFETELPFETESYESFLKTFEASASLSVWPDFRKMIKLVSTPILRKYPPTEGSPGMSIKGELIPGLRGTDLPFPKMRNLRIDEHDGLVLVSTMEGYPFVNLPYSIHVQPVYILDRDLSESRHFSGIVVVNGSVHDHVRLSAEGDVFIRGNIDGAVVLSGGHVFVGQGIKGKDTAVIKAAKSIRVGFAERCTLEAEHSIYAGTLIQSYSVALDAIDVDTIVGGQARASTYIRAKTIGSAGLSTQLFVGKNPYLTDKIAALKHEMGVDDSRLTEMRAAISEFVLKEKRNQEDVMLRHLRSRIPRVEFALQIIQSRLEQLLLFSQFIKQAEIIASERIYAGTLLSMDNFDLMLENTLSKPMVYHAGRYGVIPSVYDLKTPHRLKKERI
jgi:uncharacterized protein